MNKCSFIDCSNMAQFADTYCADCCDAICKDLADEWESIAETKAEAVLATVHSRYANVPVQLMLDIFGKSPWDSM